MKWIDIYPIVDYLIEKFPDVDPKIVRFIDLRKWILEIPEFDDDPNHSNEKIFEAIQQAWIDQS